MASEDVIELGSSDDEVAPAPKRKKMIPNAMIQIPTNLHGVTIKPTTSKGAGTQNPKHTSVTKLLPKTQAITVTKVSKLVNPLSNKCNGKTVQKPINRKVVLPPSTKPISNKTHSTEGINPVNLFKKINSQVVINKVTSNKVTKPIIRINSPKSINNLPMGITVKKGPGVTVPILPTKPLKGARHVVQVKHTTSGLRVISKKKLNIRPSVKVSNEVLTVDLDDDETDASTSSPQWYKRPEDEGNPTPNLEEENNKEPDQTKYIEITIEDSPVKPKLAKAAEGLSVTIEDSPVKAILEKNTEIKSDDEGDAKTQCKTPQSKKKLEYPKEDNDKKVIEIEIEPMIVNKESVNVDTLQAKPKEIEVIMSSEIVEIEESPLKEADMQMTSTPKKNLSRAPVKFPKETIHDNSSDNSEFHPVYQNFIKICFELENSEDMQKIVEKKVKTYYRQVPKDYTESEQFIDMVSSKILSMKACPDKMYLFIKDIVDELNLQRKIAKTQPKKSDKEKVAAMESEKFLYGENSEFDSKRQRQIRKLEKTLKKLHRAIQKLEEQEVDFDDEEDSVYLLTERYKERMMRVHAKFCQLTNTKMPSEPKVQLEPRPGHPAGPAKRLEKWINKKVPIGTPLPFPDFHDVLRCVKEANEEDKLGWNDVDIMEEARDLFIRCGRKLQRRRQENEWRTAVSRISLDSDPAEINEELRKKLEQNKQLAAKKEVEVFNKFADKQNQLKLVAEEIGDKEAEESPVESEEEEVVDEESLENKDKRKKRLKRLLQEKSKKSTEEKENKPTETVSNLKTNEAIKELTTIKDVEMNESIEDENNKQNKDNEIDKRISDAVVVQNDSGKNKTDKQCANIDETNKVESDIDELHLLQKLYSENEVNTSTVDSSDSDAPISISDTLDSDSADKKSIISIENSSYSESEVNKSESFETDMEKGTLDSKDAKAVTIPSSEIIKEAFDTNIEMECSESGIQKKRVQSNNDEYDESVEDILLASTDDELDGNDNSSNEDNVVTVLSGDSPGCVERSAIVENTRSVEDTVNLKDDNLSIGETVVGDENSKQNTINSPLDNNSRLTGSLNDKNMEVVKEVSEDVISLDIDTSIKIDGIVGEKDCGDGITERVISTNDNLSSNDEVVHECVSLDDDSSAGETAKDNMDMDKCESGSLSQDLERLSKGDTRAEENNQGEKVNVLCKMSCSTNDGNNGNDTISDKNETVDKSMIIDDDLELNLQSESSKDNNADGFLKESKLTERLNTIKTTT